MKPLQTCTVLFLALASWALCWTDASLSDPLNLEKALPGRPVTTASKGSPWPMPQEIQVTGDVYTLVSEERFDFTATGVRCDLLDSAFARYFGIIFFGTPQAARRRRSPMEFTAPSATELTGLDVNVMEPCQDYPGLESDENYTLSVSSPKATLTAKSIWGAIRGLETFSQLIYGSSDGGRAVNKTSITDFPRFRHRGFMVDSSRHFLSMSSIFQTLDAMAYNKLNVLHWHIVDDQSFPYESAAYPVMSQKGAFDQHHIYTRENVKAVIEYARLRGIRVMPEFDTPGHTQSWVSIPNLLTPCYNEKGPTGQYGPVDPTVDSNYDFLKTFFTEVTDLFPDKYVHMGGDEVNFACWRSNPNITAFMKEHKFGTDYSKLEEYYEQKLLNIMADLKAGYAVWQEVIDNQVKVLPDTVVHVWKNPYISELANVTAKGFQTLLSTPWYLNYVESPYSQDWKSYYGVEPTAFNGTAAQKALVIGGEVCMWGEYVDSTNVISRSWPRASAVAERLWSAKSVTSVVDAAPRILEQRCRMVTRGLQAEPITGPGFCPHEWV
ncbi:beta-hexosaminidase subunit alpha-like isoform X1 [Diadema setosum]|uniref:beta-hexosaminidase subunit alpha-like isoform X1 n=1 Tax=Diadema setosum TaxID=31175 RepID=UPI003B3BDB24